ncbi:MAG TPA: leucine-rich repeat domain-containing protein, partial [Spirochaetia bacterium]|nr:leucine-rich repeat domain-containing protein [Spirochaetia bacterium]
MKLSSFAFLAVLTFALASCQLATQLGISSSPSASPTPTPTPAPSGAISDYATRIPDVHLRAALEQAVGGGKTFGSITYADLAAVTWVSGTGAGTDGITNLKGIELCTGLTGVFLLFENVSDLTPLASLPNLKQIWAQDNHISDLSPVAGLSQLEALVVADNPIPLAQLNGISKSRYPHLKAIGLGSSTIPTSFAQASSIVSPFASQLTTLTLFHLSGGDTGFSGLWTSTLSVAGANLVFLNLIDDGLSEASITGKISTLTNLSFLYLQGNALTTIGGLSSLTHLTDVNLAYNQISDLTPLGTLYDAGAFRKADWAEGIYLDVRGNGMDLTTGSANETVVQKLVNSGVRVDWQTGNTTTTASLTVTSPVGTKLYGLANSASFTLPLPLTYTTNQASVEYQLNNSGTWVSASSGTNLWGSSIRPGINHLAVQAKDASGT